MSSGIHQRIANRSRKLVARCCRRVWASKPPGLTVHAADGNGTRILAESSQACIQVCRLIGISAVPPGSRTGASDLYLVPIVESCDRLLQEFTSQRLARSTNIYALYSEAVCVSLCALHHQSPSPGDLSRALGSPAKVFLWRILQRYTRFVARSRPLVCVCTGGFC